MVRIEYWFEKLLNRLQRRYGQFAIRDLTMYIVSFNAFVYILNYFNPGYINLLTLNVRKVFKGQVWRVFTYLFIPPSTHFLFIFFMLYFLYFVGTALETEWGSFRFNLYYLIGMISTTLIGFCFPSIHITNIFLNISLFLAFATLYPDFIVYLFFIIPIKVKYLAIISWLIIMFNILFGSLTTKLVIVTAILNYLLFFGGEIIGNIKLMHRKRKALSLFSQLEKESLHKCFICGKTENDDSNLEFRVCNICSDGKEYCLEHLESHEHK